MQRVRRTTRTRTRAGTRTSTGTPRQGRWAGGAHAARRGRGSRGPRRAVALLLLVPTFLVQAASTSAGAAVVAGFEVDGNTTVDAGGQDWAGLPDASTHRSDPVGNADTSTFKGSKELEHPTTWEIGTGLAPNQDDISDVYVHDAVVDDDVWGFIGFRRHTTTGVTNFDVELNKQANIGGSTFEPTRSVGDVMVRFEQDGNKGFRLTSAYFWRLRTGPSWVSGCLAVAGYTPGAGWCPVGVDLVPFAGATGEGGHFGEGAFNLTSLLELGGGEITCLGGSFGTMNIRTFTGNADESALKDYVDAVSVDVGDTCGAMRISKVDQFGNAVPGATFSISPHPVPGGGASPLVVTDGGAGDPDGAADGAIVIDPASPGTYTVIETAAPAGHELPQPVSARTWTVTVGEDGVGSVNTPLTVTDRRFFAAPTLVNESGYDVDHDWLVSKSVSGPRTRDVPEGTPASVGYEVRLTALDATTSGFGGTVTVTNPSSLPMVGTLSAQVTGGAACTVSATDASGAAGLQVELASGANPFTYTCPTATLPGGTTATLTWAEATYPSPDPAETYTRSDASAFAIDQVTDATTTVTDTFDGGAPQDLGTFDWSTVRASGDPAAHTVVVATYARDVPGVPGTCTDHPNTARESADGTSDSETVTVCVGRDLDVTTDASLGFRRELLWDVAKSGPGTVWVGEDDDGDLRRTVDFTVDVTADGRSDSRWALTGTIRVDNPNAWDVTVEVTDTVVVDGRTLPCTIAGGASVAVPAGVVDHPVTYECEGVEQGAYVGRNTVTIDWGDDPHAYPRTSASDTVDVEVAGDPDPANATVTLSDLLDGTDVTADLPQASFDWDEVHAMPDHTQRIAYSVELEGEAGACVPHANVVTIDQTEQSDGHTVEVCSPGVEKQARAGYGRTQLWDLDKAVDKTSVEVAEDGSATFHYTVTATPGEVVGNGESSWTGDVVVTNPAADEPLTVDVTDLPDVDGWTCSFDEDATAVVVAAGGATTLDYTCAGSGHPGGSNTAVVSFADDQSVSDTVDVEFAPAPDVDDTVVPVYDDTADPQADPVLLGTVDADDPSTWELTYSLTRTGVAGQCVDVTNTAWLDLSGTDDPEDSATATVCAQRPLQLAVEASADLARDYAWSVGKVADATQRTVDGSGNATFTYTVTAAAGAATDSGWRLQGVVTVANPNQYADGDVTADVTASTDLGGGADCTVTGGEDALVEADGPTTLPVVCAFGSRPAGSGTVTVTATWDPPGEASSASASASTPVTFGVRSETGRTVQVVDDQTVAGRRTVLDPALTWSEGLVRSYTYSLTLAGGAAGACRSWTNTATVDRPVGTDPTASATVLACTPAAEVLPEQAFGKAVGAVRASCQGTVRARLSNRTGETVVYRLAVGRKVHRITVRSQTRRTFVTTGRARARVTLEVGSARLDTLRVPARCQVPEVLPDTGLRATSR